MNNNPPRNLDEVMELPNEYYSIVKPKIDIVQKIKQTMEDKQLSIRKLAKSAGMKHPQIVRVTSGENYNIETLLKILDVLELEIDIKVKEGKKM